VRFLELARQDLQDIIEFNKQFSKEFQAAVVNEIKTKTAALKTNPKRFAVYQANTSYRRIITKHHLVFYMVDEDAAIVSVCRILHQRMDIPRHI
jgi:plasmid stabilization system protein ParE